VPKVVLDTVILIRALINPYNIWGRLIFQYRGRYRLIVSQPLIDEFLEVIERPELVRKFRALPGMDREAIRAILAQAETVAVQAVPAVSRDPKDDPFLATAVAAGAAYLVTEDQDLLVLDPYEGIRIVTAAEFIRLLEDS
jgi:putative PIN family toxin of toxin-antitoxin system